MMLHTVTLYIYNNIVYLSAMQGFIFLNIKTNGLLSPVRTDKPTINPPSLHCFPSKRPSGILQPLIVPFRFPLFYGSGHVIHV